MGEEVERPQRRAHRSQAFDGEATGGGGTEEKQATGPRRWIEGRMSGNRNFLRIIGGLAPNATYFVGRTPASAASPLAGHSDFVETSTSRARAPGAGQGTRPTDAMRKWEKYVAFGSPGQTLEAEDEFERDRR